LERYKLAHGNSVILGFVIEAQLEHTEETLMNCLSAESEFLNKDMLRPEMLKKILIKIKECEAMLSEELAPRTI